MRPTKAPVLHGRMLHQSRTCLLQDLYDGLYIQALLQRCQMSKIKNECDPHGQRHRLPWRMERPRNEWERFLDNVCLLCDSHRGGRTTTSIAVVQRPDGTTFCIATNAGAWSDVRGYLTNLLQSLQARDRDGAVDSADTADILFENAVKRSSQRVLNYARRLSNLVDELHKQFDLDEECEQCEPGVAITSSSLMVSAAFVLDQLKALLHLRTDCVALCKEAYRFRRTEAFRSLVLKTNAKQYDSWYQVQHYLGRLGTWRRAARQIVAAAAAFSDILVDCKVEVLSSGSKSATPLVFNDDVGVVLARVLPNFRQSPIFADALARLRAARSLAGHLHRAPMVPVVHAEAVVLDHFLSHGLEFAHGDPYVGCSKPSCYCCRVYFESQPTAPRVGRAHNNVWIKWRLPRLKASHSGKNDRARMLTVRRMMNTIHKDLVATLVHNGLPTAAMFDSTTGLSTSVASMGL